jgi:hypothetical protein
MTNKRNSDAGAPERTVLVVEADGARAKKLRAELERRGFAVSVRRNGAAEAAASGRESPSEDDGSENATLSEESVGILLRNLTPLELKALSILLRNAGTPISRRHFYRKLYGGPGPRESRAVDQLLLRLKDKLGALGKSIESHRGVGVLWNPERKMSSGFSPRRLLQTIASYRAMVLSFFLVVGFAAGWLLRPDRAETGVRPGRDTEELIPPPPPRAEAVLSTEGMAAAPGHGPECMIDGNTNTWFQTVAPARKRDLIQVLYRPNVRGRLSVRCGVPGSTNAPPKVRVGVQYSDDRQQRLGFVDPGTGAFSCDLENTIYKVFVAVAEDSDEPFAIRSVAVEP